MGSLSLAVEENAVKLSRKSIAAYQMKTPACSAAIVDFSVL
jgi:hypothetical protein